MSTLVLVCTLIAAAACGKPYQRFRAEFVGTFDTAMLFIGYTKSETEFRRYAEHIERRMRELDKLYDIYHSYDGLNNLRTLNQNAGIAPVALGKDAIGLLRFAKEAYGKTDGMTNAAMGSVLSYWHTYRARGTDNPEEAELPPMGLLVAASAFMDINGLVIDEAAGTAYLAEAGMSVDVGAMGKSYAARLIMAEVEGMGLTGGLLSAGGNITAVGKPLDGRDRWGVGIQDPDLTPLGVQNIADTVYLTDRSVSCSGGYQRYYVVDGVTYCHIIDPETLMPANRYKNVSVIHDDPAMADALSTALFILPIEDGRRLAARENAEALWIDNDNEWTATAGYTAVSKKLGGYSAND